jgi:hypothetical protein
MAEIEECVKQNQQNFQDTQSNIESFLREIEANETKELKAIIEDIRKIARQYKQLELRTRQFVSAIHEGAAKTLKAADFVLKKSLPPAVALRFMQTDFNSLEDEAKTTQFMHIDIFYQLDVQACRASEAKKRNDARIEKSEGLKDAAIETVGLSIPGVGFGRCIRDGVASFTEDIQSTPGRIVAGAAGLVCGAALGAVVTIISPALLALSGILASISYVYSKSFEDISEKIKEVQNVIEKAQRCIGKIDTALKSLEQDIRKYENSSENEQAIRYVFELIKESSAHLICMCTQYEQIVPSCKYLM